MDIYTYFVLCSYHGGRYAYVSTRVYCKGIRKLACLIYWCVQRDKHIEQPTNQNNNLG